MEQSNCCTLFWGRKILKTINERKLDVNNSYMTPARHQKLCLVSFLERKISPKFWVTRCVPNEKHFDRHFGFCGKDFVMKFRLRTLTCLQLIKRIHDPSTFAFGIWHESSDNLCFFCWYRRDLHGSRYRLFKIVRPLAGGCEFFIIADISAIIHRRKVTLKKLKFFELLLFAFATVIVPAF